MPRILSIALPGLLAFAVSWTATRVVTPVAWILGAIDYPGPRKVHTRPIPRLGGVAVVVACFVTWAVVPAQSGSEPSVRAGMLLGLVPVLAVAVFDDIRSVRPRWKFAWHLLGAIIAVSMGVHLEPDIHLFDRSIHLGVLTWPVSVMWIVGVTNAFNLADGLDGLSSGLALMSAVSFCGLQVLTSGPHSASTALAMVGALIGFLPYNLYPAKIFLGDTGATFAGFCLACLGIRSGLALPSGLAILVPLLVLGVPLAEAMLSIVRRIVRRIEHMGGGIFAADSDHIHHRLLAAGVDHHRAVLLLYGINATVTLVAFGSLFMTTRHAALLLAALLAAAFVGVQRLGYDEFALLRRGLLLRFYDAPVLKMSLFPVFVDIGLVTVSVVLAIGLKYEDWVVSTHRQLAVNLLAVQPLSLIACFEVTKVYRGSWRHASVEDLVRAAAAVFASSVVGVAFGYMLLNLEVNVSFLIIYTMVLALLIAAARSSFRILQYWKHRQNPIGEPVLVYGAGHIGALAVREMLANKALGVHPVGFIDDDPAKHGRFLNGFPVLGPSSMLDSGLPTVAHGVIVASAKIPNESISTARRICDRNGMWLMRFRVGLSAEDHQTEVHDAVTLPAIALTRTMRKGSFSASESTDHLPLHYVHKA